MADKRKAHVFNSIYSRTSHELRLVHSRQHNSSLPRSDQVNDNKAKGQLRLRHHIGQVHRCDWTDADSCRDMPANGPDLLPMRLTGDYSPVGYRGQRIEEGKESWTRCYVSKHSPPCSMRRPPIDGMAELSIRRNCAI